MSHNREHQIIQMIRNHTVTMNTASITVGASPFIHQDTDKKPIMISVIGGTVSAIDVSVDGTTYYATGMTAGIFTLLPDMYIRVTYTVVPTMRRFY